MTQNYSVDLQKLFLEMILQNTESYVRIQNIFNPDNFDRSLKSTAEFIKTHVEQYAAMPKAEQVAAITQIELRPIPDLGANHYDWFMTEFESFTKRQELERAILKSADLIEKGEIGRAHV